MIGTVPSRSADYTPAYNRLSIRRRIDFPDFLTYAFCMSEEMADALRKAIRDSGKSANALADETGVPQPTITRFLNGADMMLSTAQRIASHLGLELVKSKRARGGRSGA